MAAAAEPIDAADRPREAALSGDSTSPSWVVAD
jgi:hypothetical protein